MIFKYPNTPDVWKLYAKQYHSNFKPLDLSNRFRIVTDKDITLGAHYYLNTDSYLSVYPGKAYAVAIVYATLLHRIYKGSVLSYLADPELLAGDKYFEPYNDFRPPYNVENKLYTATTYKALMFKFDFDTIIDEAITTDKHPSVKRTIQYFFEKHTHSGQLKLYLEQNYRSQLPNITLSINPIYKCNLSCEFCYLSKEQLSTPNEIDFEAIKKAMDKVKTRYNVTHIDLYGGELSALPNDTVQKLIDFVIDENLNASVSVNTNLTVLRDWQLDKRINLSVSYDGTARALHDRVLTNMLCIERNISVLTLATPKAVEDLEDTLVTLSGMSNVISFEVKPYSQSVHSAYPNDNELFEKAVRIVQRNADFFDERVTLTNLLRLDESLAKEYNAYSGDHLYIAPTGEFAVLEFNSEGLEYFKPVTLEEYGTWATAERLRVETMECKTCPYKGNCLTEHYRRDEKQDNCSGYKPLLDWYAKL